MTIEKNTEGARAEWKLSGWLDTQSAPELEAALNELAPETEALTLDLAEVEYVSSAGLRQLVAAHKKLRGNLTLRNVSSEIQNVIRMTGLDRRLRIEA
ncbi:MAG: STAS domain-containing protein [Oscillospiraceae bacterium]|nr:STAS domain-containing protein [Oscillospiraceae bacterium]MBR7009976.1 STAS domain-containing protein [Oscillospiraceae bacterium]